MKTLLCALTATVCLLLAMEWSPANAQTIDELIMHAMRSSHSSDFIQDNDTVLVEGDILFTAEDWERIEEDNRNARMGHRTKRKATAYTSKRWTNKEVPYYLANVFSSQDRAQIQAAMNDWMRYTCIRFRPASNDRNYIYLQDGGGCSSYVGMSGGSQAVTLARGCRVKSVIIHELGHAIGFQHEQTRPDRDNYVTIYQNNILPQTLFNFERYSTSVVNSHGVPYDYSSIMHYGQYAFSSNGRPTIITRDPDWQHVIGKAQGHSFRDLKLANIIYDCASHCGSRTCPGEGYLDKNCVCQCPGSPLQVCTGGGGGDEDSGETGGDCQDEHENCNSWASQGYCSTNPGYMHVYCQASCDVCDDDDDGGDEGGSCTDNHQNCNFWAGNGECNANPTWMHENCQRSCDTCGGGGGGNDCVDQNDYCSSWANSGYCRHASYVSYMNENCPQSCNTCGMGGSDPGNDDDSNPGCTDMNEHCTYWAGIGQCYSNAGYMGAYCRRACGLCV